MIITPAPSPGIASRHLSVDALRGLAAILMVQQHLGIWLVDRVHYFRQLRGGWQYLNMTGGIAAPLFVILAGASAQFAFRKGMGSVEFRRRGLLLLAFGFCLNLLVPSWFSWGSFYILHNLGVWWLTAPLVLRLSDRRLFALTLVPLLLAIVGQAVLRTPMHLNNSMMRDVELAGGPLRLALLEGQFPLLPWYSLALGGAWAARQLLAGRPSALLWTAFLVAGAAGLLRSLVLFIPGAASTLPLRAVCRTSFFPLSTLFAVLLFAIGVGLLGVFAWAERRAWLRTQSALLCWGRSSLSLLFLHIVLFREGSIRLGIAGSLSPTATLSVILTFIVVWQLLAKAWSRLSYRFGFEWLLRKIGEGRVAATESTKGPLP